jgi:hypothetical protein
LCDGASDSAGCTGDECHPASQVEHHRPLA